VEEKYLYYAILPWFWYFMHIKWRDDQYVGDLDSINFSLQLLEFAISDDINEHSDYMSQPCRFSRLLDHNSAGDDDRFA